MNSIVVLKGFSLIITHFTAIFVMGLLIGVIFGLPLATALECSFKRGVAIWVCVVALLALLDKDLDEEFDKKYQKIKAEYGTEEES